MTSSLEFLDTGARSGAWNMEFDLARAYAVDEGSASPLVRVYHWLPWCISLGKHQSMDDIRYDRARDDGIDVVYRPTGGRAILHAEELTYSVVVPAGEKGTTEIYRAISDALVEGLRLLVPEVGVSRSQPNFQKLYREPGSIPCFSSSARYEIEYQGRKLVGSAQRRVGATVLQHGSVLLGRAHLRLSDYLALDSNSKRLIHADMEKQTVTLEEILQRPVTFEEVASAVRTGFERAWSMSFHHGMSEHFVPDKEGTYL